MYFQVARADGEEGRSRRDSDVGAQKGHGGNGKLKKKIHVVPGKSEEPQSITRALNWKSLLHTLLRYIRFESLHRSVGRGTVWMTLAGQELGGTCMLMACLRHKYAKID